MRHGDASAAPPGGSDGDRPLTARGRNETREVAAAFGARVKGLGAIYTSPLVRAVQTGEVFAQALRFDGPVNVLVQLASGCAPDLLLAAIPRSHEDILLVGHLPSIEAYSTHVAGRSVPAFGKSVVQGFELPSSSLPGKFLWMLAPGAAPLTDLP